MTAPRPAPPGPRESPKGNSHLSPRDKLAAAQLAAKVTSADRESQNKYHQDNKPDDARRAQCETSATKYVATRTNPSRPAKSANSKRKPLRSPEAFVADVKEAIDKLDRIKYKLEEHRIWDRGGTAEYLAQIGLPWDPDLEKGSPEWHSRQARLAELMHRGPPADGKEDKFLRAWKEAARTGNPMDMSCYDDRR